LTGTADRSRQARRGATQLYAHVPKPAAIAAADRVSGLIADARPTRLS
jgi:hypothetical protein